MQKNTPRLKIDMKTEHKLAAKLKEMMAHKPLDSISVQSLSSACDINRKTFYYHFHDIYDLLTLVFLNEKVDRIKDVTNHREMLKCIYDYYLNNQQFLDATIASAGRDLFEQFIYNVCYRSFLQIINNYVEAKKISLNDRKSIARFYASGYSFSIVYYFTNYRNKTLEGLKHSLSFLGDKFLYSAIKKATEVREKEK